MTNSSAGTGGGAAGPFRKAEGVTPLRQPIGPLPEPPGVQFLPQNPPRLPQSPSEMPSIPSPGAAMRTGPAEAGPSSSISLADLGVPTDAVVLLPGFGRIRTAQEGSDGEGPVAASTPPAPSTSPFTAKPNGLWGEGESGWHVLPPSYGALPRPGGPAHPIDARHGKGDRPAGTWRIFPPEHGALPDRGVWARGEGDPPGPQAQAAPPAGFDDRIPRVDKTEWGHRVTVPVLGSPNCYWFYDGKLLEHASGYQLIYRTMLGTSRDFSPGESLFQAPMSGRTTVPPFPPGSGGRGLLLIHEKWLEYHYEMWAFTVSYQCGDTKFEFPPSIVEIYYPGEQSDFLTWKTRTEVQTLQLQNRITGTGTNFAPDEYQPAGWAQFMDRKRRQGQVRDLREPPPWPK